MIALRDNMIVGIGNPLLDMEVRVDKAYLDKWQLKENDAILAEDKHVPLFAEIHQRKDTRYAPGGATQNSMRIAQWVLRRPNTAAFFGCVGDDEYGRILESKARAAGVNVHYQINKEVKTGTCAALIYDEYRSLLAHLAAANCFTEHHLESAETKKIIDAGEVFYIAGFHLTVCPPAIQWIAEHCHTHKKTFCMNLSAPFICQFFKEPFHAALPYVDILFGNETEAVAFSKAHDFGTEDIPEIAKKLAAWEKKNAQRHRIVIITQGPDDVIMCQNGMITRFPAIHLKHEEICDTNGAGDAFVGGFLAQYVMGKPLDVCVRCGIYCATECLKLSGCTVPEKCLFSE